MKFAIVVPARKNSKSLKNKNLYLLKKKKLIEHTFLSVKKLKNLKFVLSDDKKIRKLSKKYMFNNSYVRPPSVSSSKTSLVKTLLHFLSWAKNKHSIDFLVILQPTSPLRNNIDVIKAINLVKKKKLVTLFSASESLEHPYESINILKKKWNYNLKNSTKYYRRQDYDINSYFINGAIYIVSVKYLLKYKKLVSKKHGIYKMPKIRSIDINDINDFRIAEKLL